MPGSLLITLVYEILKYKRTIMHHCGTANDPRSIQSGINTGFAPARRYKAEKDEVECGERAALVEGIAEKSRSLIQLIKDTA